MNPGKALLLAAAVSSGLSFLLSRLRRGELLARPAGLLGLACLATAEALLLAAFIRPDFSLRVVYESTAAADPLPYRLAAAWSGKEGSLSLLTLAVACGGALRRRVSPAALLVAGLAAFMLGAADPFARLARGGLLWIPADGLGMNPALKHPLVVVHPPILLAGLGLTLAWAMAVLGGEGAPRLLRLSWAVLTAGCALGAAWASAAPGWGGYWSWDPVESASLLPWLALTAAIHLPGRAGRRWLALAAAAAYVSVFGALAVARGYYPASVHSFAGDGRPWPLLALGACGGAALLVQALRNAGGAPPARSLPVVLALSGLWLGVAAGLSMPSSPDRGYYDAVAAPLGLFIVLYVALSSVMRRPQRVAAFAFLAAALLCWQATGRSGYLVCLGLLAGSVCLLLARLPGRGLAGGPHLGLATLALGVAWSGALGDFGVWLIWLGAGVMTVSGVASACLRGGEYA